MASTTRDYISQEPTNYFYKTDYETQTDKK